MPSASYCSLPGKYTEGVVLVSKIEALFYMVPPSLFLALGMTEKHKKAERAQMISELDAGHSGGAGDR